MTKPNALAGALDPAAFDPLAGAAVDWDAITGRPPFAIDWAAVRERISGRAVMVIGAGGSLGRPLTASLAAAQPSCLVLYDHHESSLFRLRQGLTAAFPSLRVVAVLGDVRQAPRLARVMAIERPHLVFHLAAYKHVPWGEEDAEAFAEANVVGARHVVRAARVAGVDQIVYPSTDKAIDPPSLYGATKRLVEGMLAASVITGGPRATLVRFVNVLGSQGSVGPTFLKQIAAGQPLTLTDSAMTRYWITPQHGTLLLAYAAGQLVTAAAVTPGGIGVVEGSLTATLVAYGAGNVSTIAAVLLYRMISYWLLLAIGWPAWAFLHYRRRDPASAPPTDRPAAVQSLARDTRESP